MMPSRAEVTALMLSLSQARVPYINSTTLFFATPTRSSSLWQSKENKQVKATGKWGNSCEFCEWQHPLVNVLIFGLIWIKPQNVAFETCFDITSISSSIFNANMASFSQFTLLLLHYPCWRHIPPCIEELFSWSYLVEITPTYSHQKDRYQHIYRNWWFNIIWIVSHWSHYSVVITLGLSLHRHTSAGGLAPLYYLWYFG